MLSQNLTELSADVVGIENRIKVIKTISFDPGAVGTNTSRDKTVDISSLGFTEAPELIGFCSSWLTLHVVPNSTITKDSISIRMYNPRAGITGGLVQLSLYGK